MSNLNKKLLNPEIQNYINANLHKDLHSLLLKKSPFPEVSAQEIAQQIRGKQVAEKKFPELATEGVIYPPNLNLEQTSSQATALHKAKNLSGKRFLDLTTGFGIDAYFLSKKFEEVTLVEQDAQLLELVKHNWLIFNRKAHFINQRLEEFLQNNDAEFDLIYLDPARRNESKKKVFLLEDLSPNILEIQEQLLGISNQVMIKLSPLIDLKYLFSVLKNISKIEILAVKNDVKEVLVFLSKSINSEPKIICTNLQTDEPDFEFSFAENDAAAACFGEPENYLYLPNNAVLKSGAFNLVSKKFNIKKLHPNTQLYTSKEKLPAFPGRIFEVEEIDFKSIKKGGQYNVISKNFNLKPEEIRKKYKIKDGGTEFLIFTTTNAGKKVLLAH